MKHTITLIGGPAQLDGTRVEVEGRPATVTRSYHARPNSSRIDLPLPTATYRRTGRRDAYRYAPGAGAGREGE